MEYKAVILDLDGTLLDNNKNISCENTFVLKKLHDAGVLIMAATGRRYVFARKALIGLGLNLIVLSNNGNAVWNLKDDRKISASYFEEKVFRGILETGNRMDLYPILHIDLYDEGIDTVTQYEYTYPAYKNYIHGSDKRHRVIEDILNVKVPNVMLMCYPGDLDLLVKFRDLVHEKFRGSVHSHITMSLKKIGPLLEISHVKGTKWKSACDFAAGFGIKQEEIIAIGDDSNDIDMIKNAGLGVAMKNAIPEVIEAADLVTENDNNNSGVARVLKSIYKI